MAVAHLVLLIAAALSLSLTAKSSVILTIQVPIALAATVDVVLPVKSFLIAHQILVGFFNSEDISFLSN